MNNARQNNSNEEDTQMKLEEQARQEPSPCKLSPHVGRGPRGVRELWSISGKALGLTLIGVFRKETLNMKSRVKQQKLVPPRYPALLYITGGAGG